MNSSTHYLEVRIKSESAAQSEMLMAWLFEFSFDSFEEADGELIGYIAKDAFEEHKAGITQQIGSAEWTVSEIENKNWNEDWESNFQPIVIEDQLHIRASFHSADPNIPLEIVIDPKMSFGTGHHQTTYLCSKTVMKLDVAGKDIMDMGSGTGILAILAKLKNANRVVAIDNDEWAFENCKENVVANGCESIEVLLGDALTLEGMGQFDLFIANINRNILLRDLQLYAPHVKSGGQLLLSGFYAEDVQLLTDEASSHGFSLDSKDSRNNWCTLLFSKPA
jgi:ribosomal protein L11 methyltransferase